MGLSGRRAKCNPTVKRCARSSFGSVSPLPNHHYRSCTSVLRSLVQIQALKLLHLTDTNADAAGRPDLVRFTNFSPTTQHNALSELPI